MKTAAILLALLVLALPALAFAQGSSESGQTGLEGGEDVDVSSSTTRPVIHALGLLGKGIASSPGDPMDFMLVKVGVGAVKVTIEGEEKRTALGVLKLDGDSYRLRDVSVVDGHATADIYSEDEKVGSIDVSSVLKDDVEVWAGELIINGDTYNLYIIGGARRIKADELRDKVSNYCQNNPNDTDCREKVGEFCQNNPEDARCKALFRKHCIAGNNMDDVRCREYVNDYCKDNPGLGECVTLEIRRARSYCEENSDSELCRRIDDRLVNYCRENPDNEGCIRAKEVLQNRSRVLSRLREYVTKNISELNASAIQARLVNTRLVSSGED